MSPADFRRLVDRLSTLAEGGLTSGDSSANLMGLTMAREAKAPVNEEGSPSGVVYALALLGLGRESRRVRSTVTVTASEARMAEVPAEMLTTATGRALARS